MPARLAWLSGYAILIVGPMAVAFAAASANASRTFVGEVGVAAGYLAASLLAAQAALVARVRPPGRVFGVDALLQFHRAMALSATGFLLLHPLLLMGHGATWAGLNPFAAPVAARAGAVALWTTAVIVVTSVARRRCHLGYEVWQRLHALGAVVLAAGMAVHVHGAGRPGSAAPKVVDAYAVCVILLALRQHVLRPLALMRRPWVVTANLDVGGSSRLVRVRPDGHPGWRFEPGQFAWFVTGRSPFTAQQHPLSCASSAVPAADGTIEFAIKALGDWSSGVVPALAAGTRVWVDGPYGSFTPPAGAPGLVLVAGGIGVSPMVSILRTMADRHDACPAVLFYAAHDSSRVVYQQELTALAARMSLRVVYVFEQPDAGWSGARGRMSVELLRAHLPSDTRNWPCFICGPAAMIDATEALLATVGVPSSLVHAERFEVV